MINSVAIGQNLVANGSFANVNPQFGISSCTRTFGNNLNPGDPGQVPNWTAADNNCTDASANVPLVVRLRNASPCFQTMPSSNNADDNYLLLQNIYLSPTNHLCDDRARQNFLQPLGVGTYTLSLAYRFEPDNIQTAKTGSPATGPTDPSSLEIIMLSNVGDCNGTTVATIPINANASNAWVTFTQNFQIGAGQTARTLLLRLTGVAPGQRSHVFLDDISIIELQNCQKNSPLYLQGSTTWTGTRFLNRDVILVGGATLNINGGQVNFANSCGIYVASGVTLNVNNATLTNSCGGQWAGIISNGTNSNVTLTDSRIEHAVDGLRRQSGTVVAENTVFINNRRDVEYSDKSAAQTDFFRRCTFRIDNNYRGQDIRSRITMWNSENVNFLGCTFTNTHGNPDNLSFNPNFDWQGIYAVESSFFVDNFNEATPSRFERFSVGIRIANIGVNRTAQIKNSRLLIMKRALFQRMSILLRFSETDSP